MAKLLIKGGRVVDPANKLDRIVDILIENNKISRVANNIRVKAESTIDASGKIVMPGLVDMHVHLREPGREDKETIASGTLAAIKGGVTSCLAMPNTSPAIDSPENVDILKKIIKQSALANVFICGTITKGRQGKETTDISKLKKCGVIAISDDGSSVDDSQVFLKSLKLAKAADMLVICHCEDRSLSNNGAVNLGIISTRMGLRGISSESEYRRIERDISLAQKVQARIHIAHVSCKESVALIAKAKKKGIKVTAETAPHYFALCDEDVVAYDTNLKMNPPLRSRSDRESIREGLRSGVIDCIASDHAPHTENEKDIEFDRAEFGVIGLETELAVSITELVETKILSWPELVKKISFNPAVILRQDKGTLGQGKDADITIVDANKDWIVKKDLLISKSKNSAFLGKKLKGVVEYTIVGGKLVYENS